MDLYVERQCIDQMKSGNLRSFVLLFDANFEAVYRYVARRIEDNSEVERIVRLTFLDALGQVQNTPTDVNYIVWLYSLAKPRVWEYMAKVAFPQKKGLMEQREGKESSDLLVKAEKMMMKLSLEEREILRLKFFEQVSDGDVMATLGLSEGTIGPKIYRVLKRAHFLLFGESEERHGVYFGELSGLFERLRDAENVEIPEAFKLNLKVDLTNRIERRDFAIEAEQVKEAPKPFEEKTGSSDPAKIFVDAVREMRADEAKEAEIEREKFEKREVIIDFVDRWKSWLVGLPVAVLVMGLGVFVVWDYLDDLGVKRGFPDGCAIEVAFEGDFSDGEKRSVNEGISKRICDHFEVKKLLISRKDDGVVEVKVDVPEWNLQYRFVQKIKDWRIKKYERTLSSNKKSGEVSRDFRGLRWV